MEIKLTTQESEQYFYNALCNGLGYMSGYGLSLNYDDADYKDAKAKLNSPCFEDVLMQILKDGKTLIMVDDEGDNEYTKAITMSDVHHRVAIAPLSHLMDMINESDDATTADVILQAVFFNEIVFG